MLEYRRVPLMWAPPPSHTPIQKHDMNSQNIKAQVVWRARLPTKPIHLLTIRDRLALDHEWIPPGHNHVQNCRRVYGRVLRPSISLADAPVREDPSGLIHKIIIDYEITNSRLVTIILDYTLISQIDHGKPGAMICIVKYNNDWLYCLEMHQTATDVDLIRKYKIEH